MQAFLTFNRKLDENWADDRWTWMGHQLKYFFWSGAQMLVENVQYDCVVVVGMGGGCAHCAVQFPGRRV